MRMNTERFKLLCDIGQQPFQSTRAQLLIIRRAVRHIRACRHQHERELAQMIRKAKLGLPFTQAALDGLLEAKRAGQQVDNGAIHALGAHIVSLDRQVQRNMTFAHVADIFCINVSHRVEAETYYNEHGLLGLLFSARMEDTASSRRGDWRYSEWGPSVIAVNEYMIDWMLKNSDKLPDPFAPGGPLDGVPTYRMTPGGTLRRNALALTLHNQDGTSRVIQRSQEVRHD